MLLEICVCLSLQDWNSLITDYKNNNDEYFVPDKEIITYLNKSELMDKLDYYFDNNKELQDIAISGTKKNFS